MGLVAALDEPEADQLVHQVLLCRRRARRARDGKQVRCLGRDGERLNGDNRGVQSFGDLGEGDSKPRGVTRNAKGGYRAGRPAAATRSLGISALIFRKPATGGSNRSVRDDPANASQEDRCGHPRTSEGPRQQNLPILSPASRRAPP